MPEPVPRVPFIAANWKMNKTIADTREYVPALLGQLDVGHAAQVALCVPFTDLASAVELTGDSEVIVLAQNMHQEEAGAFTGEISARMLLELGVHGAVLGHSERRRDFGETDRALQEKVPAALAAGLTPVLCVGETEEEREAGETQRKLRHQVQEALLHVDEDRLADVVVAYEPIWAIGTGRVASPDQAQEAIAFIRALVGDRSKAAAAEVRVIYGGSVSSENAAEILAQPDVDGALVGGASLDAQEFAKIVAAAP
ncbi:MAG: triose-phosphate isomerase [Actinobacteria bacterium]|nr:triose-phosphate isomerase [Actinomycetota bacterium]